MVVARMKTPRDILERAAQLIEGPRDEEYAGYHDCHAAIARLWSAYLGLDLMPRHAAEMLMLLKLARSQVGKPTIDTYVDMAAYAAIAGALKE